MKQIKNRICRLLSKNIEQQTLFSHDINTKPNFKQ